MNLDKLEYNSLKIIENLHDPNKDYILAFSGGKDSIVINHLAQKTWLPVKYIHTNTTIDWPGNLKFIRTNFPHVKIVNPKLSFYRLVEKKGLPTRHRRWCCEHLKEYVGKGQKVIEGIRLSESNSRKKRNKEPERCDIRYDKIHVMPILYWSDKNVWDYIKKYDLPFPELYKLGFNRLGCIGCPLANQLNRIKEYQIFPRYAKAIIKAIERNINNNKCLSKFFDDPHEAFYWWISEFSITRHVEIKNGLFKINYKQELERIFNLNF